MELEAFSPELAHKKELVVANKMDLATDDEAINKFRDDLSDVEILAISGATRQGIDNMLEELWRMLHPQPVE
jgi:GTP-binding protein